jgi:pimeloyl-ACP methyl ester carboxylesterase
LGPDIQTIIVSYPTDDQLDYDALIAEVARSLPNTPHVIVAESFSGPIGIEIAASKPHGLRALILSTSFASTPRPALAKYFGKLVGTWCFHLPLPTSIIRLFMAGAHAPLALCRAIQESVKSVKPAVMALRLQEVMRRDATAALRNCPVPVFYLNATKDRLLGNGVLNRLTSTKPDMDVIDVPGPHLLLQAAPEICAHQIKAILEGLD